jgi:predicted DNA-binding transcriptional regulator AlpA
MSKNRRTNRSLRPLPGQLDLFLDRSLSEAPAQAVRPSGKTVKGLAPHSVQKAGVPTDKARATTTPPKTPRKRVTGSLLDVTAAAEHCGLSASTLNKLRCRGAGPKFLKLTGAAVRYDPKDLDLWIESRRRSSTSETR